MQVKLLSVLALVSTLTLSGCGGMTPNEATGTAIGGVTGAVVGGAVSNSAVGAGVGAVAGGVIGHAVGRSMDNN